MHLLLVSVGFWLSGESSLIQEKTISDVLFDFSKDLREAINATGVKDKDTRSRLSKAAQEKFNRNISSAGDTKNQKPTWDYLDEYLDDISMADKHFREAADKVERGMWLTACKQAFQRRRAASKEPDPVPTTDKVYRDLNDALGKIEKRFTPAAAEFRAASYTVAKEAFTALIGSAKSPAGDQEAWYTRELQDVDRLYPTRTDDDRKKFAVRNQLLKSCAKVAFDRARVAPK